MKKINFADYAVKLTTLSNANIIQETNDGLLIRFQYNNVTIQHWFPKSLTHFDKTGKILVPSFVYEEAIAEIDKSDNILVNNKNNLINNVSVFLVHEQIQSIFSELPDMPDFTNVDPYIAEIWGKSQANNITSIENRTKSVQNILNQGFSIFGDISLEKGGYHQYVTCRIHEFAENWLAKEDKKNTDLKKNNLKKTRNSYNDEDQFEDERFKEDEYEWTTSQIEEQILEELGLETWDELVKIVQSIKNYSFQSNSCK